MNVHRIILQPDSVRRHVHWSDTKKYSARYTRELVTFIIA